MLVSGVIWFRSRLLSVDLLDPLDLLQNCGSDVTDGHIAEASSSEASSESAPHFVPLLIREAVFLGGRHFVE